MLIDVVYLILLAVAVFKGYSKGFVVAVFSFLAIFIGLAASLKLSATVAVWLDKSINVGERLLPVLAFLVVLISVAILTRIIARLIEKTLQIAMLGFINRLGGILLYVVLYTIVFSIVLFYISRLGFTKEETIADSHTYSFIAPWGPKAINAFSDILPPLKNMFLQLENFFARAVEKSE